MKNIPVIALMFALAAFTAVTITGCKDKKKDEPPDDPGTTKKNVGTGGGGSLEVLKAEIGATISGAVKFKGTPPAMEDDERISKSSDKNFCESGMGIHVKKQTWLVNSDGTVRNVLVFLAPPKGKKFAAVDPGSNPHAKKLVNDQPFCQFVPHVFGVQSDLTPVVFKNSAAVAHNVKIDINPTLGDSINKTLGPKEESSEYKFKSKGALVLDMTCSSHGWMAAKIGVFDHPYFAVSDDKGNFEIKNAPVGVDLVVHYWHESFGGLNDKKGLAAKSYTKGENKADIELP